MDGNAEDAAGFGHDSIASIPCETCFGIACFPYQEGDRFFLPSIVKRPSPAGSEPLVVVMPLARPYSSKPPARQFPIRRWSNAGRGRGTEREPLSVLPFGHAAQVSTPRVHCCTFFSIGRAIWFPSLSSRTEPLARRSRNFHGQYHLGRPRHSLSGGAGGTPDLRRFRNNQRVSVPSRVSTWFRSYRGGITCS